MLNVAIFMGGDDGISPGLSKRKAAHGGNARCGGLPRGHDKVNGVVLLAPEGGQQSAKRLQSVGKTYGKDMGLCREDTRCCAYGNEGYRGVKEG
jgi:hypothetical protein